MKIIKFGVLTVSDSCFNNENIDRSGPTLMSLIKKHLVNSEILFEDVVPDDVNMIKDKLILWSANDKCDVILTTGGTGFTSRDVTHEATRAVITKETPGISHAMMNRSLVATPNAMLSRAISGIRDRTLIINFPGSVKAVVENFEVVSCIIPHAVSLIQDDVKSVKDTHQNMQQSNAANNLTSSKVQITSVATRARKSEYTMLEVDDALKIITSICVQNSDTIIVSLNKALGHVLAEDVRSYEPLPPFPASIKDGYAVRSCDGAGKHFVCDVKAAGDNPQGQELKEGQCVRISTGAPVPAGADAVVQVEDTEVLLASEDSSKELEIDIKVAPVCGQDIRKIGSDIEAHSIVLKKHNVLNAAEIGILAAVGKTNVRVFKRLVVGVISTGNEIQDPSEPLQPGRIRDSNKTTLINLLKQYSYEAEDFGVARDDPTAVKHAFETAFEKCDMVITSGGVSMGEFDVIKRVLVEDFGAMIHFGRVNMKPGKPTTFATCLYKDKIKIVFGLPGNPVSATVTCLLFVIPALKHCENRPDVLFPKVLVESDFSPIADPMRPDYQRVVLTYKGHAIMASTTGNQISSKLNSFVGADGLMLVPPQMKTVEPQKENLPQVFGPATHASDDKTLFGQTPVFGQPSGQPQGQSSLFGIGMRPHATNQFGICRTASDNKSTTSLFSPSAETPIRDPVFTIGQSSANVASSFQQGFSVKQKYMCYILNKY